MPGLFVLGGSLVVTAATPTVVMPRESGGIQYAAKFVFITRGSGILDHPPSPLRVMMPDGL
jgi:hypothetical protein